MNGIFQIIFLSLTLITAGDSYSNLQATGYPLRSLDGVIYTFFLLLQILYLLGMGGLLLFPRLSEQIRERFWKGTAQVRTFWITMVICILVLYEIIQDILFLGVDINPVNYAAYRQLIIGHFSILLFIAMLPVQVMGMMIALHWQRIRFWLITGKNRSRIALVGTGLISLMILLRSPISILPSPKQEFGFNDLNAPLLGIQVGLATAVLVLFSYLSQIISRRWRVFKKLERDSLFAVILFMVAFFLWSSAPSTQMAFTDIPRPPNNQYYPVADPLNYEISAQSMLVGQGLGEDDHPGFRILVAGLHLLAGDDYTAVLRIYLLLVCLIPVILYLIGKELGGRFAGVLAAVLSIIRIRNSIYLAKNITVINPRELMTEPIAALGLLIATYLLILWLKGEKQQPVYLLLLGGLMGCLGKGFIPDFFLRTRL